MLPVANKPAVASQERRLVVVEEMSLWIGLVRVRLFESRVRAELQVTRRPYAKRREYDEALMVFSKWICE